MADLERRFQQGILGGLIGGPKESAEEKEAKNRLQEEEDQKQRQEKIRKSNELRLLQMKAKRSDPETMRFLIETGIYDDKDKLEQYVKTRTMGERYQADMDRRRQQLLQGRQDFVAGNMPDMGALRQVMFPEQPLHKPEFLPALSPRKLDLSGERGALNQALGDLGALGPLQMGQAPAFAPGQRVGIRRQPPAQEFLGAGGSFADEANFGGGADWGPVRRLPEPGQELLGVAKPSPEDQYAQDLNKWKRMHLGVRVGSESPMPVKLAIGIVRPALGAEDAGLGRGFGAAPVAIGPEEEFRNKILRQNAKAAFMNPDEVAPWQEALSVAKGPGVPQPVFNPPPAEEPLPVFETEEERRRREEQMMMQRSFVPGRLGFGPGER